MCLRESKQTAGHAATFLRGKYSLHSLMIDHSKKKEEEILKKHALVVLSSTIFVANLNMAGIMHGSN